VLSASHFLRCVGFGFLYAGELRKRMYLNKVHLKMKYQLANEAQLTLVSPSKKGLDLK
jgi:hypothetical protein